MKDFLDLSSHRICLFIYSSQFLTQQFCCAFNQSYGRYLTTNYFIPSQRLGLFIVALGFSEYTHTHELMLIFFTTKLLTACFLIKLYNCDIFPERKVSSSFKCNWFCDLEYMSPIYWNTGLDFKIYRIPSWKWFYVIKFLRVDPMQYKIKRIQQISLKTFRDGAPLENKWIPKHTQN